MTYVDPETWRQAHDHATSPERLLQIARGANKAARLAALSNPSFPMAKALGWLDAEQPEESLRVLQNPSLPLAMLTGEVDLMGYPGLFWFVQRLTSGELCLLPREPLVAVVTRWIALVVSPFWNLVILNTKKGTVRGRAWPSPAHRNLQSLVNCKRPRPSKNNLNSLLTNVLCRHPHKVAAVMTLRQMVRPLHGSTGRPSNSERHVVLDALDELLCRPRLPEVSLKRAAELGCPLLSWVSREMPTYVGPLFDAGKAAE